ncbi:MAG: preprotein translocase subunit YajC [Chitinispirillia bacterium]|nr:preprotein translocase subunit YajC [Chitinispirillia bacterium]MCL2241975.1 preprotein translocase subunit YajC [Chitinispirillia bacterium]
MITVAAALPVLAQEGTGEGGQPGPFGGSFLFIMLSMILIIYFIMIRPEQKRQKERTKMLSALKKGDKILTIGGIYAVIQNVKDATYIIKSGEGAVLEISKSAVQNIINDPSAVKDIVKEPDEQVKEKA